MDAQLDFGTCCGLYCNLCAERVRSGVVYADIRYPAIERAEAGGRANVQWIKR